MIGAAQIRRIWLASHRVDFRKGHDGLMAEAYRMNLEPLSGDLLIFVGRDKRRFKLLYSDDFGMWVSYKRFHAGKMQSIFRFLDDPSCYRITMAELAMLLDGTRFSIQKRLKPWPRRS